MPTKKNNAGSHRRTPSGFTESLVRPGRLGRRGADARFGIPSATSPEETSAAVIAMPDYPAGRGGMRMVAPASPASRRSQPHIRRHR